MCDSWKPGINNEAVQWIGDGDPQYMQSEVRLLEWMKDTISEYCDEENGMELMRQNMLIAAKDLHSWHLEKQEDLSRFIANLELTS